MLLAHSDISFIRFSLCTIDAPRLPTLPLGALLLGLVEPQRVQVAGTSGINGVPALVGCSLPLPFHRPPFYEGQLATLPIDCAGPASNR